jgi:hypothetical protein
VDRLVARYGDRRTRAQAECYVDRVADQLGAAVLDDDDTAPEQRPRLTRIRVDCTGVASLGTSAPPTSRPAAPGGGTAPLHRGQDAALDRLYDACAGGSGAACDELFEAAPVGSEYEAFAITCGGRTSEVRCVERYPG